VIKKLVFWLIIIFSMFFLTACTSRPSINSPPATSGSIQQKYHESNPAAPAETEKTALLDVSLLGQPVLVAGNFKFAEGPAWDKRNNVLLFSDIDASRIYRLSLPNTISVYREPSKKANGLTFDIEGHLLAAEYSSRSVTLTLDDGSIKTVAKDYQGKRFNSPNDLTVRNDGTIFFTDPTYGLENRIRDILFMGLYRIDYSGEVILESKFENSPNGVVLSPDQKTLYLALTAGNHVLAFNVAGDGTIGSGRTFANVQQPDGMAVDITGNVYVAGLDGVYVFSFDGQQLGKIKTERQPTNCEFGGIEGKNLFITTRECLYQIDMPIPGFKLQ
jgi:gluconolactonase